MNATPFDPTAPVGPVPLRRLDPDLPLPRRAHADDAGVDLYSAEDVELAPGQRQLVGTGVAVALPTGTVGLVHPRSGLAARQGLSIVNAPGTVDSGYRGEIKVGVINQIGEAYTIEPGERVAQMVILPVSMMPVEEVETLGETDRGAGGFGSTGTK